MSRNAGRKGVTLLHDRHHKVSSPITVHKNTRNSVTYEVTTNNSVKYEVLVKQYLPAILDIGENSGTVVTAATVKH